MPCYFLYPSLFGQRKPVSFFVLAEKCTRHHFGRHWPGVLLCTDSSSLFTWARTLHSTPEGLGGQFVTTYHAYWLVEQKHCYTVKKCRWPPHQEQSNSRWLRIYNNASRRSNDSIQRCSVAGFQQSMYITYLAVPCVAITRLVIKYATPLDIL